ncbi:fungal-specific transcription factor domain-containing protein [Fusarium flagelliforme]|uniref:fungal-specific transcription factor domain-containing protein n=1 Tax=Fusarium flagelliforme TaxID=2675880 RepID=UPI001E8E8CFD|nr:fungal-specific transcription factor domain-containing protein [Fusarium flagelliforme]KAH7196430.1 fungal-specific transcription factor domain-containing protein [Fusarium flagelliforme]
MPKRKRDSEPKKTARLTCKGCRLRKVRCDGGQPVCGICIAYGETCDYDRPPPMTQIRAMADRIAELEQTVKQLRNNSTVEGSAMTEQSRPTPIEPLPPIENTDKSLDEPAYYDTTSAVHDPGDTPLPTSRTMESPANCSLQALPIEMFQSPDLDFFENEAIGSASIYLNIPQDVIRRLFTTHWTWVHANFMFVPRAIFLRDAATAGPNFSPFLLTVLCLHSTRFRERHLTENLLARAKLLFSHEIHNEGSIPLVQALLQFSAREIGRGSVSQAWLYGGMAFRVAIDIGLFSEASGSEDSTRTRLGRHLAWSCYSWDKTLSLYLGRTPSLPEPPKWEPAIPETLETGMWPPYSFVEDECRSVEGDAIEYTPRPAHLLLTFAHTCKISVIINDVLLNIYGSKRTRDVLEFIQSTRGRLQTWRANLPAVLNVDYKELPCPPTHMVAQHMLYHTTMILLHRPFLNNKTCRTTCQEASEAVEQLLQLLETTFGFLRFTYIMAYCTYTAATVVVKDMKDGRPGTKTRFETFMRALNAIRTSCPGIQRSIDILTRGLNSSDGPKTTASNEKNGVEETQSAQGQGQMPAFPYYDFSDCVETSINPFFDLDSFPQLWFDDFSENMLLNSI